jgi:hypothetical protein
MNLQIITANQRLNGPRGVKALVIGPSGVGKTSLLRTVEPSATLFIDLEAGDLSVQDVPIDTLRPKTWDQCRDLAAFLGGPNPALPAASAYSETHYESICANLGDARRLDRYASFFVDSITVAGRLCFGWSCQQPEAFSERTGKPDLRAAYGLHAREMLAWFTQLQHARAKNVIFVGILEFVADEVNRGTWQPQIEGSKTGRELPGIVDEVITMQFVSFDDTEPIRCFVCKQPNPFSYPAKDRSGRLDLYEKPNLGDLIAKIAAPASTMPSAA